VAELDVGPGSGNEGAAGRAQTPEISSGRHPQRATEGCPVGGVCRTPANCLVSVDK
jgi:hypothetical protein